MKLINLTINNIHVSVPAGTTLLLAAKSVGIYIPTLCSHPDLPPAALEASVIKIFQPSKKEIKNVSHGKTAKECGLCIVEIEGNNDFLNSCIAQAKQDMVVITNSDCVKEERKKRLIPILSRHRHACLTCAQQEGCSQSHCSSNVPENERCCSQFGNCELRNIVNFVGISEDTPKWIPTDTSLVEDHFIFKVDYSLCIGCTRCVRICNNLRGVGAIGFVWDSQNMIQVGSVKSTLIESDCKFCTTCVEVCPTGALKDKDVRTGKREEDLVPCKATCPAHINIPGYLRAISTGNFDTANTIIREKILFPASLGRICTHPCEEVCRRKKINSAISICALKRFVSDMDKIRSTCGLDHTRNHETGKKVAIIGAGPTGLTASFYLWKKGHNVTLYDSKNEAGGMLRYGIPKYRLPRHILQSEIQAILSLGIKFKPNKQLGSDFDLNYLQTNGTNAILLAIGAQKDRKIPLDGLELDGVFGGINFLTNLTTNSDFKIGKNLVVIGGGNVAIDVAMTAIRCGAKDVSMICLESEQEMPANPWEIKTAKSENIKILPSWAPRKILGENGKVVSLEIVRCRSVFDKNGVFNPQCDYDTTKNIITDQILMAVGQQADLEFLNSTAISTKNGMIVVNKKTLETTSPNIYAGGDVTSMPGSVIAAIASGRKAAKAIDAALGGTGLIDKEIFGKVPIEKHLGKSRGFAKWDRQSEKEIDIKEREGNFKEIVLGFEEEEAIQEAKRCLQCDLRLMLSCNSHPPEKWLALTIKNIDAAIPYEIEGVYKLFDENKSVMSILGTSTLRNDLIDAMENETAKFFEFEKDKMYSKRESELIQKHLQEYGEMPKSYNDLDDLF